MKVYEPDSSRNSEMGIVLINHLGSMASSDSGRDAENLKDTFKLVTVAVDRPGSGLEYRRDLKSSLGSDYIKEYRKKAQEVARQLSQLGINRVLLTGRSAGGGGAFAFARTEDLPVSDIAVFEPIGWAPMTISEGQKRYRAYLQQQRHFPAHTADQNMEPNTPLSLPLAIARVALMGPAILNDRWHNAQLWADAQASTDALYVAENLTDIPVHISFAAVSMAATPYERAAANSLAPIRETSATDAAPFRITTVPHTVHKSFDNRELVRQLLQPIVDEAVPLSAD